MSKLNKEEIEILIYDKYPFGPISVYEPPSGEEQYPPTKYIVPKPKFEAGTPHEYYYEYYRPYVSVFFMMKAIKTLEATGNLDEMKDKDRKYNHYPLHIEAEKEGLGGAYDEDFDYDNVVLTPKFNAEEMAIIRGAVRLGPVYHGVRDSF